MNKLEREENLLSAFSFFDKDGSGYITIDELQQACKEFGLAEVHLDEMIKEIDQDDVSLLVLSDHDEIVLVSYEISLSNLYYTYMLHGANGAIAITKLKRHSF